MSLSLPNDRPRTRFKSEEGFWGAVSAVTIAVLTPLLTWWIKSREQNLEKKFTQGLDDSVETLNLMTTFRDQGAERIILFTGHNGGGIPQGGNPFYISACHWIVSDGHLDVISNYKNLLVDTEYMKMLQRAIREEDRTVEMLTAKMPQSQLKRYYEAESVHSALTIILGFANNKMYFLSLARYDRPFTEREITLCQLKAQTLWNALTNPKKFLGGRR